jgi:RNA polymerase sigma-70 factor, ECF subfamily
LRHNPVYLHESRLQIGGSAAMRDTGPCHPEESERLLDEASEIAQAQRDPCAFALLYDRYVDDVYRYCYRRLGDVEEAADMTSLIFARALAALPRYHGTGSFRSWLFAIAHNAVIDGQHQVRSWVPLQAGADQIDPAPSPEEVALRADAARQVRAVLIQLPQDQRQVVELRLAGLTNREMAAILGRSVPAIKMLQARALIRLRSLLDAMRGTSVTQTGHN